MIFLATENAADPRWLESSYLGLFHALMIIAGLLSCFRGAAFFRWIVAILGGFCGALLGAALGYEMGSQLVIWLALGGLAGGILGAVLAFSFLTLGVAFAGSVFGVILLLPWIGHMEDPLHQVYLIFAAACVLALISIAVMHLGIRIGTAFIGAFGVVYGGWYFFGGPAFPNLLAEYESIVHILAANPLVAIIMLMVGLLGTIVQLSTSQKGS